MKERRRAENASRKVWDKSGICTRSKHCALAVTQIVHVFQFPLEERAIKDSVRFYNWLKKQIKLFLSLSPLSRLPASSSIQPEQSHLQQHEYGECIGSTSPSRTHFSRIERHLKCFLWLILNKGIVGGYFRKICACSFFSGIVTCHKAKISGVEIAIAKAYMWLDLHLRDINIGETVRVLVANSISASSFSSSRFFTPFIRSKSCIF